MDPIVVKGKDGADVEIKDVQAFYDAHEVAKADLVTLRSEKKDLEAQVAGTDEEAVAAWKKRALLAEARSNLEADGVKDADRIVKRLDLSNVDFDEDDNLSGFDEAVAEFKADFPELFDAKRRAGRSSIDANADTPTKKELSPSEQQVAAIYGN